MFYLVASVSVVSILVVASMFGRREAVVLAWALILVLPSWMHRTLGAADFNLRTVIVVTTIVLLFTRMTGGSWPRIVLTDLVILALVASVVSSRLLIKGPSPSWALRVVNDWLLPYVFGRLLIANAPDLRSITRFAVVALCVLFGHTVIESAIGLNLLQSMSGSFKWHTASYRFGLKRAEGTLTHSIYYGLALLLLLPWSIHAWSLFRRGLAPRWWSLAPAMNFGCILLSGSRGAIIGTVIALFSVFIIRREKRLVPGTIAFFLCLATVVYWGRIVESLRYIGGENAEVESIVVNGSEVAYSATLHRLVQMKVYERAVQECGFLGFANVCTDEENPRYLRHVEYHLQDLFFSIDNHYLFFTLDCGYVGMALFLMFSGVAIAYSLKLAIEADDEEALLVAAIGASVLSMMLMLWTVWLPPDLGFYFLLNCGILAGWRAKVVAERHTSWASPDSRMPTIPIVSGRLVPGHPMTAAKPKG